MGKDEKMGANRQRIQRRSEAGPRNERGVKWASKWPAGRSILRGVALLAAVMTMTAAMTASESARADEANPQQCRLEISTVKPILPADQKVTTCVKVGVTGFEMATDAKRPELNIAIVLDRSGSMSGEKIEQAKEAAACAVNQMRENDIVSVVAYSTDVEVLVPATKLGDKKDILAKIEGIEAGGTTALYAGTEKGAEEVKKFFDKNRVNRVILLSDGLANVGPSSPEELGKLGQKIGGDGITVTTLGLGEGFNEDLMIKLAAAGDGNHVFITKAKNMIEVFDEEFKTATAVVAGEVACRVTCADGIRPVRVLNRNAEISGQEIQFGWNQIYSGHQRYVMIEVEVPAGEKGQKRKLAAASLTYANMKTNATDRLSATVEVSFSDSEKEVAAAIDKKAMEDYVLQTAALTSERAVELRDKGDIAGARSVLKENAAFLRENADALDGSALLSEAAQLNASQEAVIGNESGWNTNRKLMRAGGAATMNQQYSAPVK